MNTKDHRLAWIANPEENSSWENPLGVRCITCGAKAKIEVWRKLLDGYEYPENEAHAKRAVEKMHVLDMLRSGDALLSCEDSGSA